MKKILYIEASPRKDRSHSINVTKKYIDKLNKDNEYEVKKLIFGIMICLNWMVIC